MRFRPFAISLSLMVCLAAPGIASAAILTQSFTRTLMLGDNLPEGLDTVSLTAARFDVGLGSLTGVTVTLASDFSGGAVFYHPTLSLDFTYVPRHYLEVEMPDLQSSPSLILDQTLPILTYTDSAPGGGSYWRPEAQGHFERAFLASSDALAGFEGAAPFTLAVTIEDRSQYTASSPFAYINDKYAISSLVLTVTYEYVPVPEPTILVSGLIGLGCKSLMSRSRVGPRRSCE